MSDPPTGKVEKILEKFHNLEEEFSELNKQFQELNQEMVAEHQWLDKLHQAHPSQAFVNENPQDQEPAINQDVQGNSSGAVPSQILQPRPDRADSDVDD